MWFYTMNYTKAYTGKYQATTTVTNERQRYTDYRQDADIHPNMDKNLKKQKNSKARSKKSVEISLWIKGYFNNSGQKD